MLVEPDFLRSAPFVRFKRGINRPEAMEYILFLLQRCQVQKKTELDLSDDLNLELALGLPEEVDASEVRELLVECGFIKKEEDSDLYSIDLFKETNKPLIAYWNNGSMGGRPKKKKESSDSLNDSLPPSPPPSLPPCKEESVPF